MKCFGLASKTVGLANVESVIIDEADVSSGVYGRSF